MKNQPFHLALPCNDIEETKMFYTRILGATLGRNTDKWVDINLFENQITFTRSGNFDFNFKNYRFGGQILPSFHFGVIVEMGLWYKLYTRLSPLDLEVTAEVTFLENEVGEHLSFFIKDPNGYMVEFKSFKAENEIFNTA